MISQLQPNGLPLSRPIDEGRVPSRVTLSLDDGYETVVYVHTPPAESSALPVLYMHGIQSHPGWFIGSAAALAERGHPVFQVTRRGSGENRRDRGHATSARQLLDDVGCACRFILESTAAKSLHLLGVSWGGKLLAAFATHRGRRGVNPASLTMVSPGLAACAGPSVWTKMAIAFCLLTAPRRLFDIPLSDPQLFTDNLTMRGYLRNDRFALHRATARLLFASRELDGMIRRAKDGVLDIPTTLLLAHRDRIINNKRVRRIVQRLTAGRAHVREFPCAHVPEFEEDPQFYHDAIAEGLSRGE